MQKKMLILMLPLVFSSCNYCNYWGYDYSGCQKINPDQSYRYSCENSYFYPNCYVDMDKEYDGDEDAVWPTKREESFIEELRN